MQFRMRPLFIGIFLLMNLASEAQFSLDSMQGVWHLYKCTRPADDAPAVMEYYPPVPNDNLWIFKGDSLFRIYYPYQCQSISKVRIDSNRVFKEYSQYPFAQLYLDSGMLVASVRDGFQLYFQRKSVTGDSVRTVRMLQRDSVNCRLLVHRYTMITHFSPDDEAAYDFAPPIQMPSTITIGDSAAALKMIQSGVIYIQAGNKRRPFYITEIRWNTYLHWEGDTALWITSPEFVLVPAEWWTGEWFRVIYKVPEPQEQISEH